MTWCGESPWTSPPTPASYRFPPGARDSGRPETDWLGMVRAPKKSIRAGRCLLTVLTSLPAPPI